MSTEEGVLRHYEPRDGRAGEDDGSGDGGSRLKPLGGALAVATVGAAAGAIARNKSIRSAGPATRIARRLTGRPRSARAALDRLLDQPGDVVKTVRRVIG